MIKNYEGLPINKYLTVGKYATKQMIPNPFNKLAEASIEVVCRREDITYEKCYEVGDNKIEFIYDGMHIICHLSDNFPTLQMFLDNYDAPNLELCFLVLYRTLIVPVQSWIHFISEFTTLRRNIRFTNNFLETLSTFEKEINTFHKRKKAVKVNQIISKEKVIDIWGGKFKEVGLLNSKAEIQAFEALTEPQRLEAIPDVLIRKALYRIVCPEIFEGKKGASPHAAYRWALKRMCTKDAPIRIRRDFLLNYKYLDGMFDGQFISQFIKKYKEYGNSEQATISAT